MKTCKNCGASNEDVSLFCAECGTKFEENPVAETQPAEKAQPMNETKPAEKKKGGNAMAIIALISAILSLLCCYFDVFAAVLAVVAIVLSIICLATKKGSKGMVIAALIIAIIGFAISVFLLVFAYVIIPNSPEVKEMIETISQQVDFSALP